MSRNFIRNVIGFLAAFGAFATPAWAVPFISITDLTDGSPSLSVAGVDITPGSLIVGPETVSFSGTLHIPFGFGVLNQSLYQFVLTEPGSGISDILMVTGGCTIRCDRGTVDFLQGITASFTSVDGLANPTSGITCTTLENGTLQPCALIGQAPASRELLDLFVQSSTDVPEPMTLTLFGAGLAGLGAMRRRRKSKS